MNTLKNQKKFYSYKELGIEPSKEKEPNKEQFVVLVSDQIKGMEVYGIFYSYNAAKNWAKTCTKSWYIKILIRPEG